MNSPGPTSTTIYSDTGWKGGRIGRNIRSLRFNSSVSCEIPLPQFFCSSVVGIGGEIATLAATPMHPPSPLLGMLGNATVNLLTVFRGCETTYFYDKTQNPRRVLTRPSKPVYNSGYDNEKWDYVIYVNDIIGEEEGHKFLVLDLLGHGTFGQVAKCQNIKTKELVAVKVIKNQPAYFNQSMMEVTVLELLNNSYDVDDSHHIVRMRDTFVFRNHLCVVVELLSLNLYELVKQNQYRGFSINLIRIFLAQTLDALQIMKDAKIVHCDLKPENILLKSVDSPAIKVIDFGSACHENQTLYTYIQSRFYRSPEVLLGLPYSAAIDMWSLGCIAAELFLGLPIFPGASNYDQLTRIVASLGLPPAHMLELGKDARLYFEKNPIDGQFSLKTREKFSLERGKPEPPPKRYFSSANIHDLVMTYPVRPRNISSQDLEIEMEARRGFLDLLRGLLCFNPVERWSPVQAMAHPFITGRPFTVPFDPMNTATFKTPSQPISQRPRSNTLGSLTRTVPAPLQKVGAAAAENPGPVPKERQIPDSFATDYQGLGGAGSVDTLTLVVDEEEQTQAFQQPKSRRKNSKTSPKANTERMTSYIANRKICQLPQASSNNLSCSLPANAPMSHHQYPTQRPQGQYKSGRRPSINLGTSPGLQPTSSMDYVSSPLGNSNSLSSSNSTSRRGSNSGSNESFSKPVVQQVRRSSNSGQSPWNLLPISEGTSDEAVGSNSNNCNPMDIELPKPEGKTQNNSNYINNQTRRKGSLPPSK